MRKLLFGLLLLVGFAGSAQASLITYQAVLLGSNENPPTGSPGTGLGIVTVDDVANTMRVQVSFSGLVSPTTASHIHCCAAPPNNAGVATRTPTFLNFPLGVTSGTYDMTFNMLDAASYNPAFINANGGTPASAEAVLFAGMAAGQTYLNIHTQAFGGGEIRGYLTPQAVPEPATLTLVGVGLLGLVRRARRS